MEFRILGPLDVTDGGRSLPLGGAKQRAVLAILLTQANQAVATDRLIDLIWPDEAPDTAGHSLQVYVSQLRKVLEPEHRAGTAYSVLISQHPGYLLRIDGEALDLARFERLVDEGRNSMSAGAHESAGTKFRAALDLWRGPPLADLALQPFALNETARLTEARLRAVEGRIDADLALGRHADLVGELESLLAEHPLREGFSRQLMLALYRSGRQAEASAVYQQARERLVDELGMEPGPDLQTLLKQILNQAPALDLAPVASASGERRRDNLPLQLTSFVGRAEEVAEVTRRLSHNRLVTITGAGGVGKTRVALQVADHALERFRDGAWLVELAPVTDPSVLPQAVMAALGVREQTGRDIVETLCDHLQSRDILLVFDNCEHVIDATARLMTSLLQACPRLRILATSREALGIGGEIAWRAPSLPAPDSRHLPPVETLADYAAIALFVDRSTAALGDFALDADNAPLVAEVCERLDGIPLAIELAAAKLRVLSLAQVARRLGDRYRLLTGGSRTALPRQQTLRAAIDWSYDLLSDPQQATLRKLSVFAGGISLEAAEEVCAGAIIEPADVVDLLADLVAKSLLVVDRTGDDARYRMLETIRQYASERLLDAGEAEPVRDRHRAWFQALAEQAEPELRGSRQADWHDRLQTEHDNLRAALGWALASGDAESALRFAGTMGYFWRLSAQRAEGLGWLERALDQEAGSTQARAKALYWVAAFSSDVNDYARAEVLAAQSLAMFREIGDRWGEARAEQMLGSIASRLDQYAEALRHFELSLTASRDAGDAWVEGWALYSIGYVWSARADYPRARDLLHLALERLSNAGDHHRVAMTMHMLGCVELCLRNYDAASALLEESLGPLRRVRDHEQVAWSLVFLGVVSRCTGDYERAMVLFEEGLALFREVNLKQGAGYALCEIGIVATKRGDLRTAEGVLKESLVTLHAAIDRMATAKVLEALADVAARHQQFVRSAQMLGSAEALRTAIGGPIEAYELDSYRGLVSTVGRGLDKAGFAEAWANGKAMTPEAAVSFALQEDVPTRHASSGRGRSSEAAGAPAGRAARKPTPGSNPRPRPVSELR
ncbi:MAG: tetratricopeptide repeat protein [Chloroflexi bacterium]|nr:MAG: tetratricopeptide repeat protein [Chloroflexota bacterium]